MNIDEIAKKLIGEIRPVGETNTDNERFENLKAMCDLVEKLSYEIYSVSRDFKDRKEFSMKRAGVYAQKFVRDLSYPAK